MHQATMQERAASGSRAPRRRVAPVPVLRDAVTALDDALDTDEDDPASYEAASQRAFEAAASAEPALTNEESRLLTGMASWAEHAQLWAEVVRRKWKLLSATSWSRLRRLV